MFQLQGSHTAQPPQESFQPIIKPRIHEEQCGFAQIVDQWTRSLPSRVTKGVMGVWPSGPQVFCGLGEGCGGTCCRSAGYRSHFCGLFGLCLTKARAVSAFLVQSRAHLRCVLDTSRAAPCFLFFVVTMSNYVSISSSCEWAFLYDELIP